MCLSLFNIYVLSVKNTILIEQLLEFAKFMAAALSSFLESFLQQSCAIEAPQNYVNIK